MGRLERYIVGRPQHGTDAKQCPYEKHCNGQDHPSSRPSRLLLFAALGEGFVMGGCLVTATHHVDKQLVRASDSHVQALQAVCQGVCHRLCASGC